MIVRLLLVVGFLTTMHTQTLGQQLDSLAKLQYLEITALISKHQYTEAYEKTESALGIYESRYAQDPSWPNLVPILRFRERKSTILRRQGQYRESENTMVQLLTLAQAELEDQKDKMAWCYNLAGEHYAQWGQHAKTIECYQKAIELMEQLSPKPASDLGYRYGALGSVYTLIRDYDKAVYYHLKGLAVRRTYLPEAHIYIAWHYHQLAQAYDNLFKYEEAEIHYYKALDIRTQLLGKDHSYVGLVYNDLGVMEWRKENYDQALMNYEKALGIYLKSYGEKHVQVAKTYNNIGLCWSQKGEIATAISYLEKSLELKEAILPEKHPELISGYDNMGLILFKAGLVDEATDHIHKALSLNVDNYIPGQKIDSTILELPVTSMEILRASLMHLAILRTYQVDASLEQLLESDLILQVATKMVNEAFKQFDHSNSKINLLHIAQSIYLTHLETLYQLYEETAEAKYLERIYEIFERGRSVLLAQAIKEVQITEAHGVPASVLEDLRSQRHELMNIEQLLAASAKDMSDTLVQSLQAKVVRFSDSIEWKLEELKINYPRYYQHFHSFTIENLESLQRSLKPGQQLISYFKGYGIEYSIYTLTINQASIEVYKKKLPTSFYKDVQNFHQLLSRNELDQPYFAEFCRTAHQFYLDLLEEPLASIRANHPNIEHLIIVPNSNLSYLPFETLLMDMPDTSQVDYRELPYLLREFEVSYAPSASLWLQLDRMHAVDRGQEPYIGFAPTYASSDKELAASRGIALGALTFSKVEVTNANSIFGGKAYLDQVATKERFMSMKSAPAILHLAMHASVNDRLPMGSSLWFNSDTDTIGHAALSAAEIYGLSLKTQLSVLSACQTGYGKIAGGEGVFSLSRAFMYAGSPSLLTSLWDSNDKFTTDLMNLFFNRIKAGEGKHRALQQAKLDYLRTTDRVGTHPSNWATFVLIGNEHPVDFPNASWRWWLVFIGVVFLGFLYTYFQKGRRGK